MNNRLRTMQGRCLDIDSSCCNQNMTYDPLQTMPLAMAYVPWQQWKNVYEGCKGLEHGTIFEELIFPFQFTSRMCGNSCMKQTHYNECNNSCNSRSDMCMNDNNMERSNCMNSNNFINNCNDTFTNNSNCNCENESTNNYNINYNNCSMNNRNGNCNNSTNNRNINYNSCSANNRNGNCNNATNNCNMNRTNSTNNCNMNYNSPTNRNMNCNTKKPSSCERRCD